MTDHLVDNAIEVYCHGLAKIETLGSVRRLVFTTPDAAHPGYSNVTVKLVMTVELLSTLSCLAARIA